MFKSFAQLISSTCIALTLFFSVVAQAQDDYTDAEPEFQESVDDVADYDYPQNFNLEDGEKLPRSDSSKLVHQEIEKVLSSEDFARKKTVTRWRWINANNKQEREEKYPEWLIDFFEWLEQRNTSLSWLPQLVEILLWAVVIGLLIFVLVRYREQISGLVRNVGMPEPDPELPTTLFGLDVKKDSLPEDVVATAENFWNHGERRHAIAVLLRASLIKLLHEHGCRFFDSDTEAECCEQIDEQASANLSVYMRGLVAVWQRVAYAHIQPADHEFSDLCRRWKEVF